MKKLLPAGALILMAFLDPFADRVSEGNTNFNDKKYLDAEKSYTQAEQYLPSNKAGPDLAFNQGDARYMLGDYDGAIENYRRALDSTNRDVQKKALFNIGNAYVKKEDRQSAADAYMASLAIDPKYGNAKKNLENLFRKDEKKSDKDDKNKNNGDDKKKGQGQSGKDQQQKGGQKGQQQKISADQLGQMMEMMKKKPVRRDRNKEKGFFDSGHDKPW
jgi:Ca-activated chloride channel homolog